MIHILDVWTLYEWFLEIKLFKRTLCNCAYFLIKTASFANQICPYEQLSMPTWLPDKALKETVQSSPLELETALTTLKAVRVEPASEECGSEPKWFVLEPDYHMRALSMMCNFCEENDWKWFRYGPTRAICLVYTLWCQKRAMWLSFHTLLSLGSTLWPSVHPLLLLGSICNFGESLGDDLIYWKLLYA